MKILLTLICLAGATAFAPAQELNQFGHIQFADKREQTQPVAVTQQGLFMLTAVGLKLHGNACYRTGNGYLTVLSVYETMPATLRHYDRQGSLLWQKDFAQVVNLQLSADGMAMFHDGKVLHIIRLADHTDTPASFALLSFALSN